jgi:hypothetical protein
MKIFRDIKKGEAQVLKNNWLPPNVVFCMFVLKIFKDIKKGKFPATFRL